ncbi:FISUMP domain-containing protein [candidate division KSB1 bacterium]
MKKFLILTFSLAFIINTSHTAFSMFKEHKKNAKKHQPFLNTKNFETGTVKDFEGNEYKTIKIGNQWWIAENLRVTINKSGKSIISYAPDNSEKNIPEYGRLYTWKTAMDGSKIEGAQGLAPDGWHIPTKEEWNTLFEFLGGIEIAGKKMKEEGTKRWTNNKESDNSSGFTALPTGGYLVGRSYEGFGEYTHFWCSSGEGKQGIIPSLGGDMDEAYYINYPMSPNDGSTAAIRCVKNAEK